MRLFTAVSLPASLQTEIGRYIKILEACGADVRWVKPENLHMTVVFLGETPIEKLEAVQAGLQEAVSGLRSFVTRLSCCGAFPDLKNPAVLWIGADHGESELTALAGQVENAMRKLGFRIEERPYSAHVTIGRVKTQRNLKVLTDQIGQTPFKGGGSFQAEALTLYESKTLPDGPVYTKLSELKFL